MHIILCINFYYQRETLVSTGFH